jgi:hypothetical protein
MTSLEIGSPEVNIEYVEQACSIEVHIGAKATATLPTGNAEVIVHAVKKRESTEHNVPVGASLMFAVFTDAVV